MPDEPLHSMRDLAVVVVLFKHSYRELSCADIHGMCPPLLLSGAVYPILQRFVNAGWATFRWSVKDPSDPDVPRHRLYKLSRRGKAKAQMRIWYLRDLIG